MHSVCKFYLAFYHHIMVIVTVVLYLRLLKFYSINLYISLLFIVAIWQPSIILALLVAQAENVYVSYDLSILYC